MAPKPRARSRKAALVAGSAVHMGGRRAAVALEVGAASAA